MGRNHPRLRLRVACLLDLDLVRLCLSAVDAKFLTGLQMRHALSHHGYGFAAHAKDFAKILKDKIS